MCNRQIVDPRLPRQKHRPIRWPTSTQPRVLRGVKQIKTQNVLFGRLQCTRGSVAAVEDVLCMKNYRGSELCSVFSPPTRTELTVSEWRRVSRRHPGPQAAADRQYSNLPQIRTRGVGTQATNILKGGAASITRPHSYSSRGGRRETGERKV